MKYGISISSYETQFGPIVLREGTLDEKLRIAAQLGYDGVDLFGDVTDEKTALNCKNAFERHGLELQMYVAIFLSERGVNLTDPDGKKRSENIRLYQEQMYLAHLMGAKLMPVGFLRGPLGPGQKREAYYKILADSLAELSQYGRQYDVTPCLEPINRYEINTLNSAVESVQFLKRFALSGVGLLLDLFHMNIEDGDLGDAIRQCSGYVKHVHLPDSNRFACGSGHLDFSAVFKALGDIGYRDYVALEAFPEPDAVTCAKNSIAFLKNAVANLENQESKDSVQDRAE